MEKLPYKVWETVVTGHSENISTLCNSVIKSVVIERKNYYLKKFTKHKLAGKYKEFDQFDSKGKVTTLF
jgi:hypothetical protein